MFWSEKPKFMLSRKDMELIEQVFEKLGERFKGLDAEVEALKARCDALESEAERMTAKPHQSLKAKLRARVGKEGA